LLKILYDEMKREVVNMSKKIFVIAEVETLVKENILT
jgi:hypothetical protein